MKPIATEQDIDLVEFWPIPWDEGQPKHDDAVRAFTRVAMDARALAALAQPPAPEGLREAVAELIEELVNIEFDPNESPGYHTDGLAAAAAVIAAHIAPLLAERDALERKLEQYRSEMRGYEELAPRLAAERDAALAEAARLRDALAVIAAHNGDRWEYDDDGLIARRQPPPQEIARATLGLPEQAR